VKHPLFQHSSTRNENSSVAEQGMVRLSDQVSVASGRVHLGFACASFKRTLDRSNFVVRLRFAYGSLKRTTSKMNWARSLEVCLGVTYANSQQFRKKLRISKPFFPNTPILILPHSKLVPNEVYRSCT